MPARELRQARERGGSRRVFLAKGSITPDSFLPVSRLLRSLLSLYLEQIWPNPGRGLDSSPVLSHQWVTMELITPSGPSAHGRALSAYLAPNCNAFVFPTDKIRKPAMSYDILTDNNLSYFLNVDAAPGLTDVLLAGGPPSSGQMETC